MPNAHMTAPLRKLPASWVAVRGECSAVHARTSKKDATYPLWAAHLDASEWQRASLAGVMWNELRIT